MVSTSFSTDELAINTIRGLSLDGVEKAKSGHAGLPLGAAPMAHVLWTRHLKFDAKNPKWIDRDRFILSAGHGSMLIYSLLYLAGYGLELEDLKQFRQLNSRTPGHPENTHTVGVEMATGPLGQGVAHSVGMAIAERYLAAKYNRDGHTVIDHYTYAICSDGDLMEGVSNEAASLAGHLELGKLIWLYDDNGITIDGKTDISFTENVGIRFEGLGWQVLRIDGMDIEAVDAAITAAKADPRPTLIAAKTIIGFGSPKLAGTNKAHSNPFGTDELKATKAALSLPVDESFYVAPEAAELYANVAAAGAVKHTDWQAALAAYGEAFPAEAAELITAISGEAPDGWLDSLPVIGDKVATRKASETVINAISSAWPTLLGGSADLAESNLTTQKGHGEFQAYSPTGKTISFGVREHAMAAAVNGITLHGATRGFGASFLIFSDYARPALRLSALMETPSIFVFTHDSVGVGEDGPTHEPIEQLTSLRAIPNFNLIRPADGNETAAAWKVALESTRTPTLLALSRQALPPVTPTDVKNHPLEKGAYILAEADGDLKVIIVATGSEVQHALAARETLQAEGIATRVVSFPSWLLFERQTPEYRASVLPKNVPTVSIEAGSTLAWPRYAHVTLGIDRFGLSAPGDLVMKELGMTPEAVVAAAKSLVGA